MPCTLDQLNGASVADAEQMLAGIYEHSPWVAARALRARPFQSLADLREALAQAVSDADRAMQLALIRAHPELAGKAARAGTLTAESTSEQSRVGLTACTPEELARIQQLNRDYGRKFGFPFVICVRGPAGTGLTKPQIMATFALRLAHTAEAERAEALTQINLIAALRLADRFGTTPQ